MAQFRKVDATVWTTAQLLVLETCLESVTLRKPNSENLLFTSVFDCILWFLWYEV